MSPDFSPNQHEAYKRGYDDAAAKRQMDENFRQLDDYLQGYEMGMTSLIDTHPDHDLIGELKAKGVEDYKIAGFLEGVADAKAGYERRHNSKNIIGYDVAYDMVGSEMTRQLPESPDVIKEDTDREPTGEQEKDFAEDWLAEDEDNDDWLSDGDDDWKKQSVNVSVATIENYEIARSKPKNTFLKILGIILTACFIAIVFIFMRSKENNPSTHSLPFTSPAPNEPVAASGTLRFIKEDSKWGLVDGGNRTLIPPKYDSVITDDDNHSLASDGAYVMVKNRWGFVDGTGKELIPPKYIELGAFNTSGVACYVSENGDGLINNKGAELQVPNFDYVESDNWGFKIRKRNLWGFLDAGGNSKLSTAYSSISEVNGQLALTKNGSHGLANQQGSLILPCEFEQIKPLGDRYLVTKDGERGLYDEQGKEILPCEYGFIIPIDNKDCYYVFKNGRSGYVDLQGNELVPCQYQEAYMEGAGYAKIEHFGLIGWYDINAHAMAIPLQYDFVWGKFESKDDVVKVRKPTGEVVRIDYYGREVHGKSLKDYYKQLVN